MAGFEAQQLGVGDIFSDHYSFAIPDYQRPYSWAKKDVDLLFNDLLEFMKSFPLDESDEQPFYFLGSILLVKEENKPLSDIVDGQQRLTTLTILLAAIRALIKDDEDTIESITGLLEKKKNKLKKIESGYRLTLRKRDEKFFQEHIQEKGGLDKLLELKTELGEESQENIRENAESLKKLLEAELPDDKEKCEFAEFIIHRCCMVVISAKDIDSAYRVFSVLNNRGMPLTAADIMKSRIIGELPDEEKKDHATKWEEMENHIGKTSFSSFFSHLRMIIKKTKSKEKHIQELSEDFDSYLKKDNGAINYLNNFFYPAYQAYARILKSKSDLIENKKLVESHLFWLNKLSFNDWVPPTIRFLASNKNKQDDVLKFVRAMEKLGYFMLVSKATQNKRIERFAQVIHALDNNEDIFNKASPLQLKWEEANNFHLGLTKPIYEFLGGKNCKILLLRLDSLLYNGNAGYHEETDRVTVEHVLPQTPKPKSQWLAWFKKPKEREQLVNCLGNLVLLDKGKNSEASNVDFEEKKKKYFMTKTGVSPFALTTQVLVHKEWTADVIKKRQEDLINCLAIHWELKSK